MKARFFLLGLALLGLASCGSKAPAAYGADDIEINIPCSGIEYSSSEDYFRSNAMGISNSLEIANQKAMASARQRLAASIETTVKSITDNYTSSYENDQQEEARGRFQSISREVVSQKLTGVRVICQKVTQSPDGRYKSYVAIELAGDEIANEMKNRISADEKLRTDYEYEKFKAVFDEEMSKLE